MEPIFRFVDEYRFLSNFFPSPILDNNGDLWPTVEHAYQAMKTTDAEQRKTIRLARGPGQAKSLGRKITLRPDWENIKKTVMMALLVRKFAKGSALAEKLLATDDRTLVEGNSWHDNYWGCCDCLKCRNPTPGHNMLGRFLMTIRDDLRAKEIKT